MKPILSYLSLTITLMLLSFAAFAQVVVPEADPLKAIAELIMNWKSMGPIGIGMAIIVIVVQLSKSQIVGGLFDKLGVAGKRLLVTLLGQAYAILLMVQSGSSWLNAAVVGLITSGGAIAIYEAIKPLLKKK